MGRILVGRTVFFLITGLFLSILIKNYCFENIPTIKITANWDTFGEGVCGISQTLLEVHGTKKITPLLQWVVLSCVLEFPFLPQKYGFHHTSACEWITALSCQITWHCCPCLIIQCSFHLHILCAKLITVQCSKYLCACCMCICSYISICIFSGYSIHN
jgi:hypothetical protein